MTHLQMLTDTFDKIGVDYLVKESDNDSQWQYVILCAKHRKDKLQEMDLQSLLRNYNYFEFLNGKLAGY